MNYFGQISVDTANHVICRAMVDFADKKDSQCTEAIVGQTIENLKENEIEVEEVLADTGYSSGESLRYLEKQNIEAYIPHHGAYKPEKEGFTYNKDTDCYICSQGIKLDFSGLAHDKRQGTGAFRYRSKAADCKNCPLRETCVNKAGYKSITVTVDRDYYEGAEKRINTRKGKCMMRGEQKRLSLYGER
ncbi:hypothetical protein AGMMS49525_18310 [Bacteroidia bacterium]|nr:hypothetical protein AGMMS49525_18310 [Bacteroidia bacterium]